MSYTYVFCAVCRKRIKRRTAEYNRKIRSGQTEFYCTKHSGLAKSIRYGIKTGKETRTCDECLREFTVRASSPRIFCSSSCSASNSNRRRGVEKPNCLFCGVKLRRRSRKFCTTTCQKLFEWEQTKLAIVEHACFSGPKEAKRFLLETVGHVCIICLRKSWMSKPIPLVLDHIDGNADNWHISNMRLICANCDAQTDTYKGKNRGFGRHARRQRYKEGKSY